MPVKLPESPSDSGDALGVDDNYQAYVYDPIEDEWVPGTVMEERTRQRAAQAPQQPPPPPTQPDQPPTPPARPDVSLADPATADTAAKLSQAVTSKPGGLLGAVQDTTQTPATPDTSKDALLSEGENAAQAQTGTIMGAPGAAPFAGSGDYGTAQVTNRRALALQAQAKDATASQAESEGQTAPGQTVPADLQQQLAGAGEVDTQHWDDPYGVGNTYSGPTGMRPPQNPREYAISKGEISTTSNALESAIGNTVYDKAKALSNTDIPVVSPAARFVKKNALAALDTASPYIENFVNSTPGVGIASQLPSLVGINTPTAGQAVNFAAKQGAEAIPTTLGGFATTLPVGEIATGAGRVGARLAGLAARDIAEHAGESETLQRAAQGAREVLADETGSVRLPRPGGGTAADAARARAAENRNLGGAGVGAVDNRAMREAQPLSEAMQTLGEGLQLDPAALGISTDRGALDAAIAAIRANPAGRTAELGRLEAQRDALDIITNHDAQGAFQQIADRYSNVRASTPLARASRDEFGRIHTAMLHDEDPSMFGNVLKEPPAGASFDPITHEIRAPGSSNPDLQLQAPSTPAARQEPPTLPGTEAATGVPLRQPAPVLGSMQGEGFRGEQGGVQSGLEGVSSQAAERYQPGLGESLTPDAVKAVAPAGTPARDVNELDDLLVQHQQAKAEQSVLDRMEKSGLAAEQGGSGGRLLAAQRAKVAALGDQAELERRIVELGRKTPYDDANIIATRAEQRSITPTNLIDTPERQQLREQIANKLYGDGAAQRDRIVHIVLGPPAAGKSRVLADPLAARSGALVVDSDAAKEFLPEFQGGRYAGAVHLESDDIAANVLSRAVGAGDNMVLPLVGKNEEKIRQLGEKLKAAGYTIELHFVDVPDNIAAERAVARFRETGRFVDPDYVLNGIDSHPRATFDALKKEDWVSGYQRVSNDVARGEAPVTLESTLGRPEAENGLRGPGANDAGRLPESAGQPGAANAPSPIRPADNAPIPGLAESLAPENQAALEARRNAVRNQGQGAADAAAINRPTAEAPQPPKPAPDTGPYVRQPDGTTVEATAESVSAGVKRVFARRGGIAIPTSASTEEAANIIRQAVKEARTTGGRSLFGPGTDEDLIDEAINQQLLDGKVNLTHTGGRGRTAAVLVPNVDEGATANAIREAGAHRPEAGVENALEGDSVAPESTQQRLAAATERANNATMQTPDFAPEGRAGAGGGSGVPPAGGQGQASFPWKPGDSLPRKFFKTAADLLFGLPRAVKFGFDASAMMAQGLWDLTSHPAISLAGAPERFVRGVDAGEVSRLRNAAASEAAPGTLLHRLLNGVTSYDGAPRAAQQLIDRNADVASKLNPAFGRGRGSAALDLLRHPAQEAEGIARSVFHPDGAAWQQLAAIRHALTNNFSDNTELNKIKGDIGRRYADLKAGYTDAQGHELGGLFNSAKVETADRVLAPREEAMATGVLNAVPGLRRVMKAADEAWSIYLSKARDDIFDNNIDVYRRLTGELPTRQEANDLARWLNITSGRGELPQNWANVLSVPFTAPRLYASQAERLPVVAPFMLRSGFVRKQMAADWMAVMGATSATLGIASLTGLGSVDMDYKHPGADFMKIRIGNHRIDPLGGFGPMARATMEMIQGGKKSGGGSFYSTAWNDIVTNFLMSKLSPTVAMAKDILTGKMNGQIGKAADLSWDWDSVKKEVQNTITPLFIQDMLDSVHDSGLKGLAFAPAAFLGIPTQTYPPGTSELRTNAAKAQGYADYASAPADVKDKIDAQPDIAKLIAAQGPSAYKQASDAAHAPITAEVARQEELFNQGTNARKLSDVYHDATQRNLQAAQDLSGQFAQEFAKFNKTAYDKALEGYYGINKTIPAGQTGAGDPDFDATAAARADYLASLPADQQDWLNRSLVHTEDAKTPLHQEYDKYIADKKAAGYFALDPKDPKYSEKLAALDRANPQLDLASWKFNGVAGDSNRLNSMEAVDLALKAALPGRTVKANLDNVGSIGRPINGNEEAWNDAKATLQKFADAKVRFEKQEQARLVASNNPSAASYNKPWDKLTADQQATIHANIAKSLQTNSPQLDALLAYWGVSDTLNTQAAIVEYRKLQAKYGKDPATPTTVIKVAAGAK